MDRFTVPAFQPVAPFLVWDNKGSPDGMRGNGGWAVKPVGGFYKSQSFAGALGIAARLNKIDRGNARNDARPPALATGRIGERQKRRGT